jgi:cytochrome P450
MSESPVSYDVDVYSDEVLDDPYSHYRVLRELGPAVWLPKNQLWAISRHKDVREALRNHQVFSRRMALRAMTLPTTPREAICSHLIHRSTICCVAWSAPHCHPRRSTRFASGWKRLPLRW